MSAGNSPQHSTMFTAKSMCWSINHGFKYPNISRQSNGKKSQIKLPAMLTLLPGKEITVSAWREVGLRQQF